MTPRAAALAVALLPALLAWVAGTTFSLAFAFGLVALAGGTWLLLQRPVTRLRVAAAILAIATLPAAASLHMWKLATSFEPWAGQIPCDPWPPGESWPPVVLPVASEARYDPHRPLRFVVNLDHHGVVGWIGKEVTLAELDLILKDTDNAAPALVRADYRTPFQHFSWILQALRRDGRGEVRIAATRFAKRIQDPAEEFEGLGVTYYPHYWPEGEFAFPLDGGATGPTLRIVPVGSRPGIWERLVSLGRHERGTEVLFPTGVRYEIEGRATSAFAELSRWMEDTPPGRIEVGETVPLKYVVAVLNAVKQSGHRLPALVESEPPSAEIRDLERLPYPDAR